MLVHRRRRIYFILLLLAGLGVAVGFSLFALRQNINLYYTPREVLQHKASVGALFRLGGMVVKGSLHRVPNSLKVSFVLTDFHQDITVFYEGLLPSLFREGQGIVAQGRLNSKGVFVASQVLAKHDANYHPPGVVGDYDTPLPHTLKGTGVERGSVRRVAYDS